VAATLLIGHFEYKPLAGKEEVLEAAKHFHAAARLEAAKHFHAAAMQGLKEAQWQFGEMIRLGGGRCLVR
jgi:hypothetical protein